MHIVGAGMFTPVGNTAPTTAAAIRAGITRTSAVQVFGGRVPERVLGLIDAARLPPLAPRLRGIEQLSGRFVRILRLAGAALREVGASWADRAPPLLLSLPRSRPGAPSLDDALFFELLQQQSGVSFAAKHSRVLRDGRAGGLMALSQARALLDGGAVQHVCLGGADSCFDADLLESLERERRLHCDEVRDGFIPGEAAAFVWLSRAAGGVRAPTAWAEVVAEADASEGTRIGDGLTDAIRTTLTRGRVDAPIEHVLAGLTGESTSGKEWGVALVRNADRFAAGLHLAHPIECIGDPGAALGPLLLGLAALGMNRGYTRSPCLVWCAGDAEERAAAVLRRASA